MSTPAICIRVEKLLCVVTHHSHATTVQRRIRCIGNVEPAQVGDIFAQREFAIHVLRLASRHQVRTKLLLDTLGPGLELLLLGRSPPILQVPIAVVLTPIVIKAMSHFMPNHRPGQEGVEALPARHSGRSRCKRSRYSGVEFAQGLESEEESGSEENCEGEEEWNSEEEVESEGGSSSDEE